LRKVTMDVGTDEEVQVGTDEEVQVRTDEEVQVETYEGFAIRMTRLGQMRNLKIKNDKVGTL
jgi:hypothetical protein